MIATETSIKKTKSGAVLEKKTGTRDAVEAAIDMTKEDRSTGWEAQIAKKPERITPWPSHTAPNSES